MTDNPEVRAKEIFDELRLEFTEVYEAHDERAESLPGYTEAPVNVDPFQRTREALFKHDWQLADSMLRAVARILAKRGL